MNLKVKRIYEEKSKSDGSRILVDRLWPRGISKENAHITEWVKDVAPSSKLRAWFHKDPEKHWVEFKKRYLSELKSVSKEVKHYFRPYKGTVTLITAVKDVEHSHVPVLKSFIERLNK